MFKRLQWKLVAVFVLLVMAVLVVADIFLLRGVSEFYQQDFRRQVTTALSGDFTNGVRSALVSQAQQEDKLKALSDLISAYSGQLGINANRTCSILSARNAEIIISSNPQLETLEKTPNIITAMTKTSGDALQFQTSYMDYAYYLSAGDGSDGYIIYLKDTRNSLNNLTRTILTISVQALLGGILVALILGFLLSRTITVPIARLTKAAERFAEGDFDARSEVTSRDEIGRLVETFNYMGGVTKDALNRVASENHKTEIILEHVTNGIIAFDKEQTVIQINSSAKEMLGLDEVGEIHFDEFFEDLGANICIAEFLYLDKFKTEVRDIAIGDSKHIRAFFVPFKVESEELAGIVCVLEDFTEQFDLEQARQKFVAEVSHELKTPLTTIRTYAETLQSGYIDDKETAKTFLSTIESETDKMTALVQNLLTLSSFDAKKNKMQKEPFSPDSMLRETCSLLRMEAENKGVALNYISTTDIPTIYADRGQVERAVRNIIVNAIKYTPKDGEVKVFAGHLYNEIYIKVEDNGYGIPAKDLEHVFERFYRVDKARTREMGGTGLGLSIVKEIIENHGGTIKIESEYGAFTRVTIKLPVIRES